MAAGARRVVLLVSGRGRGPAVPADGGAAALSAPADNGPVRVARVIARLNVGGPAQHVILLSERLGGRYESTLVHGSVGPGEADMAGEVHERGVRVESIPELGRRIRPLSDLSAFVKLVRLFRRLRPHIVHTHTAKAGMLGRLAAVAARVPIRVHTLHGHVFHGYFGPAASRAVVAAERTLARLSHSVLTVSEGQAREIVEDYRVAPRERVRVMPLGLELDRFAPERSRPLGPELRRELRAGDRPVLTIVGRLAPVKNHTLFLEVAAELERRGRDCIYAIVGGGSEEAAIRARISELGLHGRAQLLGWRRDLPRIYAGSDIVLLTSHNEGTPVALIEAMAAGRPVVATAVGGVPDVLDGGRLGALVPPGDARAMADAVEALLDDPARREALGHLGADTAPARWGIDRLVSDMEGLYEELLARFAGRPTTDDR